MSTFDEYHPIIGPDKFKVENLPPQLYNSVERGHFTLELHEAIMLHGFVTGIEEPAKQGLITEKDFITIMSDIKIKFDATLEEHSFNNRGCFVKFSNVSPKDKGLKPVHNFDQFLKSIQGSERVARELYDAIFHKYKGKSPLQMPFIGEDDYSKISIILSEWLDARQFIEFRTFVFDDEVSFASQYNWWYYYEQIGKEPNRLIGTLQEAVSNLKINNCLFTPNLVADFWVTKDLTDTRFIEFNPYELCDPVMFQREIDKGGLPLDHYKSLKGLLRFTGLEGNGYENMPLDYVLPPVIRELDSEGIKGFKEKYKGEQVAELCRQHEIVQLLKPKSLVISQKSFKS